MNRFGKVRFLTVVLLGALVSAGGSSAAAPEKVQLYGVHEMHSPARDMGLRTIP